MNYMLTMAFDGSRYHGFQVQRNALSVCEVLQDAMGKALGERPDVKGCSRTDAGVHALQFCANFRSDTAIHPKKLPLAINFYLPEDIRVNEAKPVPEDFHARYSALGKEYRYVFFNENIDSPFARRYHKIAAPLHEDAMHMAGQRLVGRQDFAAFMSSGSGVEDTMRTVSALCVRRRGPFVILRIAADGYLYNMVRIIAGTLAAVGTGHATEQDVERALRTKQRSNAGDTLPPQGLFLAKVFYPLEELPTQFLDEEINDMLQF
jgi:tRNA pseudouridine38-40 synthase